MGEHPDRLPPSLRQPRRLGSGTQARWWHGLNYTLRVLLIAVGLALALGFLPVPPHAQSTLQTFGVLLALFGLYRLVSYHSALRRHDAEE